MGEFYCCTCNLKVFEVNVLEHRQFVAKPSIKVVHDVDMNKLVSYRVAANRVQPTKPKAIWAAREDLERRDREIYQQMQELQEQRDEISRLLCIGDPEDDGS